MSHPIPSRPEATGGTPAPELRLSIIVEWANTRLNGVPRAWSLFAILDRQWRAILAGDRPAQLPAAAAGLLGRLAPRAEVLVVSGDTSIKEFESEIRNRLQDRFDVEILVAPGLEYYALKNHGLGHATGDFILFVDSDVSPENGWLAHLIGSFGRPEVDVVCGQTYVAPIDLMSRAFALGWTYSLRDDSGALHRPGKFYANTLAARAEVLRRTKFATLHRRTRGAASLLGQELARAGIPVWENPSAGVAHPPPEGWRHLVVRGLAQGRDTYMKRSEERSLAGLGRSLGEAWRRFGRGGARTFRHWKRVGLRAWEVPLALAINAVYYACFALGGLLTHASPEAMGRRFRV